MIMESVERSESGNPRYKNGNVITVRQAMQIARNSKMQGFKIYFSTGCFYKEYALFDGKYREVINDTTIR